MYLSLKILYDEKKMRRVILATILAVGVLNATDFSSVSA